jgi:hypothetical protein
MSGTPGTKSAVFRVTRSGQIQMDRNVLLLSDDVGFDEQAADTVDRIVDGDTRVERFEEVFAHLDTIRIAREVAALREMVTFGLEQIDVMKGDSLGLARGGLGVFPDARAAAGERGQRGGRPQPGIDTGGLASQDGSRADPLRGPGAPGYTAGQYFVLFRGSQSQRSSESSDYYAGRDAQGTVTGRDTRDANETITHSTFWERNNDGSSRSTWINHQTGEKVQVTKDANGQVTKVVESGGFQIETVSEPPARGSGTPAEAGSGTAGNPGDEPTAGQREFGMWLWRQHRAGTTASPGPTTVVYVNPPGPRGSQDVDPAPSIFHFVEIDIAGNPDPHNVNRAAAIPADYRDRVERFVREKTGGLVNPPGPGRGPE